MYVPNAIHKTFILTYLQGPMVTKEVFLHRKLLLAVVYFQKEQGSVWDLIHICMYLCMYMQWLVLYSLAYIVQCLQYISLCCEYDNRLYVISSTVSHIYNNIIGVYTNRHCIQHTLYFSVYKQTCICYIIEVITVFMRKHLVFQGTHVHMYIQSEQ